MAHTRSAGEPSCWGASAPRAEPSASNPSFTRWQRPLPPLPRTSGQIGAQKRSDRLLSTGRGRSAARPLTEAVRTRDPPRAHRVEQRLCARAALVALGVEAPAPRERESAAAIAAARVRDAQERLALGGRERRQLQVRDVVDPPVLAAG